ncbi:MAG: mechanosensitive ion channel family protein [Xanthomonadaceae bacterium]|nr:mechanosensitive ion channel family protein [Xanthomonadaceae bacterium]
MYHYSLPQLFFSIVLGLALQDTLGNLFSGLALQIDKPYSIGDWIEVQSSGQKWIGEVYEISWRATILKGFTDEWLTIPNRIMAGAQISNFATKDHPIWRTLTFKLTHGQNPEKIKTILLSVLGEIPEILKTPKPLVLLSDLNESWLQFRVAYCILDYGHQFDTADSVFSTAHTRLKAAGVSIAAQRIEVLKSFSEL